MSYKITIEKTEVVKKTVSEWKQISDTGNPKDNGPQYGYIEIVKEQNETTHIFEQVVDEVDVPGIVLAVNKIEKK